MRVLLVEDHRDLAENVGDYLAAQGHKVDFAADGPNGLKLAQEASFDAIVLDRMLPGIDGATVCRRLRESAQANVPVLMLTALAEVDDKVEGFAAGADDYLVKPFALAELGARLDALHRRSQRNSSARQLRVADLHYDLDTLAATRAGQPLQLNPTTRTILEKLMRETHRVVPRGELEHSIWGNAVPDDDVLRVHIYLLRNVIDKPFERKLLHTIHGIGYRLYDADLG